MLFRSIDVAAGGITDKAGNDNTAAATQFTFTHDRTDPTVVITSTSVNTGGSHNAALTMIFTFSEEMTGIADGDFTFTNCNAGAYSVDTANTVFHQVCTPDTPGETITIAVAASVGQDPAGNNNAVATDFTFTYDTTAPTVSSITFADVDRKSVV